MAITFEDIKKWPPKRKAIALGIIYLLLGGAYYSLFMQSSMDQKGAWETKLSDLQEQVQEKERLAAQKGRYVREVNTLKEAFKIALTKLPDQREIFCCAGRERFRRRFYPFRTETSRKEIQGSGGALIKADACKSRSTKAG